MRTATTPPPKDRPAAERILATAHDLFYRDGIRATGIDRVIAESGVTKVTFYRHFPSKSDLIRAFLLHRHERWMAWFTDALQRHGAGIGALVPALTEWLRDPGYRGCAFINSVSELGSAQPEVVEIARSHKRDMVKAIAALLPPSRQRCRDARAIGLAVDGAIVQAQWARTPDEALAGLRTCLALMTR
jgi:AcrR family transcriptional regulator